jgi:YVTN family beta-propeller protein
MSLTSRPIGAIYGKSVEAAPPGVPGRKSLDLFETTRSGLQSVTLESFIGAAVSTHYAPERAVYYVEMRALSRALRIFLFLSGIVLAQSYTAPAGIRPAMRRPGAAGILPGGRIIAPVGIQQITGPGPFGVAVSNSGRTVVTSNGGPDRYSLTVMERGAKGPWSVRHLVAPRAPRGSPDRGLDEGEWRSVFMGLAFSGEKAVYASEGNSGRVRLIDLADGAGRRTYDLNQDGVNDCYTGDLAFDEARGVLYVIDQANFRLVAIDVRKHRILSSLRLGRLPFAIALSPDRKRAWVTNIGIFEYKALPGADRRRARETGIPFSAFGFPSPESERGVTRQSAAGDVPVPALGDPNVKEANSVCAVDVSDPAAMKIVDFIRTGLPIAGDIAGGSSPSGVLAAGSRVYVSNAHNDSITVIDATTLKIETEIPIRIRGLEKFRGVLPIGMALHERTGWLMVAEAGLNAVGVIDTRTLSVIGHVPVALFANRIAIHGDAVYVANARGIGQGPNANPAVDETFLGTLRRGSATLFTVPTKEELARHTRTVMEAAGFTPRPDAAPALPDAIRYVVVIVKENRTFDEVFGDVQKAGASKVLGSPALARFGRDGYVDGDGARLSLKHVNVTPNHHALAERWALSDNFYADSDVSVDGHHWLVGAYPNAWTQSSLMAAYGGQKDFRLPTEAPGRLLFAGSNSSVHPEEQPEAGTIWSHLERHGVPFRNFGEGFELAGIDEGAGLKPTGARFLTNIPMPAPLYNNTSRQYPGYNMNIPDQYRATQFIKEIEERYIRTGADLPRFLYMHLPNDHMTRPRPADGYPYEASYMVDNDYALGRVVEFLSGTKWWRQMAILITEDDAQGGRDHVDAHRTVLIAVGPYVKRNYVSHTNTSFPGLLKTVFRLLRIPPLNLFDAAASDLSDCFTGKPDFTPYKVTPVDKRIFDPSLARDPLDPRPDTSPKMDDPEEIRRQQRRQ